MDTPLDGRIRQVVTTMFRRVEELTSWGAPLGADRVRDGRWAVRAWAGSRLLTLLLLIPEHSILGDVRYYARQVATIGTSGIHDVLREYPAPALAVFLPAWWAGFGNRVAFLVTFVTLMIAIDAAFTAALWRGAGRRPTAGFGLWLALAPCLGPLIFTRFDLVSAALGGCTLLALAAGRSGQAGALAGLGAAVKLWPAALLPALLVRRQPQDRAAQDRPAQDRPAHRPAPDRQPEDRQGPYRPAARPSRRWTGPPAAVWTFAAVGLVAAGGTVAAGGVSRLASPITWQGQRGLQIESLFAVPLQWARLLRPSTWPVQYTRFYAFQIDGPGAALLVGLSSVATLGALVTLAWLWWRALRRPLPAADVVTVAGLLMLAASCLLVITNKTLSPQYLLWIGGLLAALGCLAPAEPVLSRANRLLVASCLLTQLLYPIGYASLTGVLPANWLGVPLLTIRNGLLVALAALICGRAVALTRPPRIVPVPPAGAAPVAADRAVAEPAGAGPVGPGPATSEQVGAEQRPPGPQVVPPARTPPTDTSLTAASARAAARTGEASR